MPRLSGIELFELDLPFRHEFRHAAANRTRSSSLFVRFLTDGGACGYGEALPRPYVTGEERGAAFDLLAERILPRALRMSFASFDEVLAFLARCDGKAPAEWVDPRTPHTAAWTAVDLALLDAFGRAFGTELQRGLPSGLAGPGPANEWPPGLRYSLVLSGEGGARAVLGLLKARAYGISDVKVKVDHQSSAGVRLARRMLGRQARIRVDSNMDWTGAEARAVMPELARLGVETFEQPLAAGDIEGMARLGAETGLAVIADESFDDAASLERLIAARACAGVNVRIAKCGGLVAALARCRQALGAGLALHVGCLVGETSQLSAAQLVLVRTLGSRIEHVEGCYGERLLQVDPVRPLLQFRRGGRPPASPGGPGFGTRVDLDTLALYAGRRVALGASIPSIAQPQERHEERP